MSEKNQNTEGSSIAGEKLQKALATAGFGSRREMEKHIQAGEVQVNGKMAHLGERVNPKDTLKWHGQTYVVPEPWKKEVRVILYNKPEGQVSSRQDPEGRETVFTSLPSLSKGRWVSVGRLDINTSGLMLFTDDGELANRLMHPSSGVDREYLVRIQGEVSDEAITRLKQGVELDDGPARFTDVVRSKTDSNGVNSWYHCAVMEGRNREVRRLWESQELRVSRLKRVRFGPIVIPPFVKPGQWIDLSEKEVSELHRRVGLPIPRKRKFKPAELETQKRHVKRLRSSGKKAPKSSKRSPRNKR